MKQHTTIIATGIAIVLLAVGAYYWMTTQPFTAKAPQNEGQLESAQKQTTNLNADISAELDGVDVGNTIETDIQKTDSDVNQL